jgi:hypothetical protein
MAYYIEINGLNANPKNFALTQNSATVGSELGCDIRIEHEEAEPKALQIDVRGDNFWVQNCNPYSIFVGNQEVRSHAWSAWPLDESIQMTRSLSLHIRFHDEAAAAKMKAAGAAAAGEEVKKTGSNTNKLIQIALIVGCFVAAPLFLLAPSGEKEEKSAATENFDFDEIVAELTLKSKNNNEYRALLKYLQQARVADRRWKKEKPELVAKYYALLLNHRLIDDPNETSKDEILASINELAKEKIRELRYSD